MPKLALVTLLQLTASEKLTDTVVAMPIEVPPVAGVVLETVGGVVSAAAVDAKLAVTDAACVIVTVQAPVPVQAPLQPLKVALAPGVAFSVTTVPDAKFCVHDAPQLSPAGVAIATVPLPVPALATVSVYFGFSVKVALAAWFALIVRLQVATLLLAQAPPHDANWKPSAGVAVSVVAVPVSRLTAQVAPQFNPPVDEVMLPEPVLVAVSV
jgi:hypothetical protein